MSRDNSSAACKADAAELNAMGNNCIACHMPNSPSKLMSVQLEEGNLKSSVYVRTHLIGVYPKEAWRD